MLFTLNRNTDFFCFCFALILLAPRIFFFGWCKVLIFYSRLRSLITQMKKILAKKVRFRINISRLWVAAKQVISRLRLEWHCPGLPPWKRCSSQKSQNRFFWHSSLTGPEGPTKNNCAYFRAFSIARQELNNKEQTCRFQLLRQEIFQYVCWDQKMFSLALCLDLTPESLST